MPTLSFVKQSPALLYSVVTGLILGALGLIGILDSTDFQRYYLLIQALALGVGCLHIWLSYRFVPDWFATFGKGILVTLLILLLAISVTLVVYWRTGYIADRWPLVSALIPFLVPFLVVQAYQYYLAVPPADYRKWYYPINGDMPDLDLLDLSKILVIQFEFLKTPVDKNFTNFKAKAPVAMTLGDLFLVFINDYNERTPASPIQYTEATGSPFGWVFIRKGAWWQRQVYLDPDLDFSQNQLFDNATIIARRVS